MDESHSFTCNFMIPNLTPGSLEKHYFREKVDNIIGHEMNILVFEDEKSCAYAIGDLNIGKYHQKEGFGENSCQILQSFKVTWNETFSCYTRTEPNEFATIKISSNRNSALLNEISALQHLNQYKSSFYKTAIVVNVHKNDVHTKNLDISAGNTSQTIFLVTKYYEDIAIQQRIEESHAQSIIYGVFSELLDLANAGVSHLGIKLENLKRTLGGNFILVGYDNAKTIDQHGCQSLVQCNGIQATPYMPPEIFQRQNRPLYADGPSVDAWCACVVLYSLLSGRLPGVDPSTSPALGYIALRHPEQMKKMIDDLPASDCAKDFLKTVFRQNSNDRPTLDSILRHPWIAEARYSPLDPNSYTELPMDENLLEKLCTVESARDENYEDEDEKEEGMEYEYVKGMEDENEEGTDDKERLQGGMVEHESEEEKETKIQTTDYAMKFADDLYFEEQGTQERAGLFDRGGINESGANERERKASIKGLRREEASDFLEEDLALEKDVLLGRGGFSNHHHGNVMWRGICDEFLFQYIKTPKNHKKNIAIKIVDETRKRNPGMLFLRKQYEGTKWKIESETGVIKATMQRLRENAKAARDQAGSFNFKGTGIKRA